MSDDTQTTAGTEVSAERQPPRPRRSWKSRLLELALWAALSLITAIVMIALSDKLLPNNF